LYTVREVLLTSSSELVGKGQIELPVLDIPYGLSLRFSTLLSPTFLPWHLENYECAQLGRQYPFYLEPFVIMPVQDNRHVLVPMDAATIRCGTLCPLLAKVGRYLSSPQRIDSPWCMEQEVDLEGLNTTAVLTPGHGMRANTLLVNIPRAPDAG
jgi:hypothetical protein